MGLGPPVCDDCLIELFLKDGRHWECIKCKSRNRVKYGLWEFSNEEQKEIKFRTFVASITNSIWIKYNG